MFAISLPIKWKWMGAIKTKKHYKSITKSPKESKYVCTSSFSYLSNINVGLLYKQSCHMVSPKLLYELPQNSQVNGKTNAVFCTVLFWWWTLSETTDMLSQTLWRILKERCRFRSQITDPLLSGQSLNPDSILTARNSLYCVTWAMICHKARGFMMVSEGLAEVITARQRTWTSSALLRKHFAVFQQRLWFFPLWCSCHFQVQDFPEVSSVTSLILSVGEPKIQLMLLKPSTRMRTKPVELHLHIPPTPLH